MRINPLSALAAISARHKNIEGLPWRKDLAPFANHVSKGEWVPYKWLVYIAEIIQKERAKGNARIIFNIPPRHGKSELVSKYMPAWILDQDPNRKIILTSYEAEYAAEWGRKVRDICKSTKDIIPKVRPDVSARKNWLTLHGGGMVSVGVGGAVTGRGGDDIIVDDPTKNWIQAYSKTHQKMLQNWFDSTLMTRVEPGGNVFLVMTRWAVDDLTGYLTKKNPGRWTVITLPALAEENDPLGREVGEALCPERFSAEALADIRDNDVGNHKFSCMYQQRPTPAEGGFINRDCWEFYEELPPNFDDSLCSWDMTFKKTEAGSYVAGGAIGRLKGQYFLMPRAFHKRMNFPDSEKAVIQLKAKYPWTKMTLVENKANGPAILDSLGKIVDDLTPWEPLGKLAQANSISAIIEAGNFLLPNPAIFTEAAEWLDDFIDEWADFPVYPTDDFVDMGSQGVLKLRERSNVRKIHAGRA